MNIPAIDPRTNAAFPNMTFDEYLRYDFPEVLRVEWVSGVVVDMDVADPAGYRHRVSESHDEITSFLLRVLGSFIEAHDLGRLFKDPFNMWLRTIDSSRCPDLMFLARQHFDRRRANYLDGPADLVVEVLSPGNAATDRGAKFYEYEAGGVPEYWIIDPERQTADFYQLDSQGLYRAVQPIDGVYLSRELRDLQLSVRWLWELPRVADVERELGIRA